MLSTVLRSGHTRHCPRGYANEPSIDCFPSPGDLCHRRSIRCRSSQEDAERCQNCYDFDVPCTYDRPSKRRKHPGAPNLPQPSPIASSSSSSRAAGQPQTSDYTGPTPPALPPILNGPVPRYSSDGRDSTAASSLDLVRRDRESDRERNYAGRDGQLTASESAPIGEPTLGVPGARQESTDGVSVAWKSFASACEPVICELLDVYMQVVYPL